MVSSDVLRAQHAVQLLCGRKLRHQKDGETLLWPIRSLVLCYSHSPRARVFSVTCMLLTFFKAASVMRHCCLVPCCAARAAGGLTVPHADVKDGKRFSTPDTAMEENRLAPGGSEEKRAFTYFVLVSSDPAAFACVPGLQLKCLRLMNACTHLHAAPLSTQGGARFLYASAARLAVINAIATLSASADVLAMAAVEVDLGSVQPGQVITVKWRGKPVFIKNRTPEQVSAEAATPTAGMRHPQTDSERVKDPKW